MTVHPDIQAALDAHYKRSDLIFFTDEKPSVQAQSAIFSNGKCIQPAGLHVIARQIPNKTIILKTISGIGDQIWSRGIVKESLAAGLKVRLQTPYPWVFWDFEDQENFSFHTGSLDNRSAGIRVATYLGVDLKAGQTVYGAMCDRCRVKKGDFRLPIKTEWSLEADKFLETINPQKPLMIYRPLVRNHGRRSVTSRNPDHTAYSEIFKSIREEFHVISVAGGGGEDIVHSDKPDTTLHYGELSLEIIAALISKSKLVFTNPGFGLVLAASVGTPVLAIFGGYEDAHNYEDTVVYGPHLLIDTIKPCRCMSDSHSCDKTINIPQSISRAKDFVCSLLSKSM